MKLLNYTFTRYLLFAALLLLISIPVFYVVLNRIFINAIDRDLYQQAQEIPIRQDLIKTENDLALWKLLDNDLDIVKAQSILFQKGPFTKQLWNPHVGQKEDYRILQKKISILHQPYVVQIKSSMIEKEDLMQTILAIQLGLLGLLLLGAVVINYFINKKVWSPFYENLLLLKNFKLEDPVVILPEGGNIQEFRQLNQSIQQLIIRVRNTYLSQKEFTENASHELQTPLSVLKFKLELLLQEKYLSKNQSELIDDMYNVITQMEQLNKNLLFLSKIENQQFDFDDRMELNQVIKETVSQLRFMSDAKSQTIKIISVEENIFILGNKQLFKNMIKNLLRNAIQYSNENAAIQIRINPQYIIVENPGKPLSIVHEKLFSRFSKTGNRRGNGLGLAIAKKIAELHQLTLSYSFKDGKHFFKIQL